MFSFELFIPAEKQRKVTGKHVGIVGGLGNQWDFVPSQVVEDDESRVPESINVSSEV